MPGAPAPGRRRSSSPTSTKPSQTSSPLQRLTALQTSSLTKRERVPAAKHDCQQAGRYPRAVPTEKRCTTPSHRLSLSKLDAPPELSASIRFDAWLRDEALRTGGSCIPSARIYRDGLGCVRDSKALKAALALLDERGLARVEQEGRHWFVAVNPALLAGVPAEA